MLFSDICSCLLQNWNFLSSAPPNFFLHRGPSNKKSELMLIRRVRAYSSFCSQLILVYLHPFHRNSRSCSQKSPKNNLKSILLGFSLKLFKFIGVDIFKKLVASACYDRQHVCAYLQPFSRSTSQQQINNHFLEGYPYLTPACAGRFESRGFELGRLKS